ncbi:MAG: PASTA domain-containing protein [Clostridiales Family XIII bacterium]|jgi:stage V sporulation protein D (sporulation-specific penicillin-binding protein)|nr:PASTA domain-containing protein [Clostridiales Family XIII bacterium]
MKKPRQETGGGPNSVQKRMTLALAVIVALFFGLSLRIGQIQIIATDVYAARAVTNQTKDEIIPARRGEILDRNGEELAVSTVSYRVYLRLQRYDTEKYSDEVWETMKADAVRALATALSLDAAALTKRTETDDFRILVATDVNRTAAQLLKEEIEDTELVNIIELEDDSTRQYPFGALAAHVLGNVNMDGVGLNGIELQYDDVLQGSKGRVIERTDSQGNPLASEDGTVYSQEDGLNVVLTIDSNVQFFVEQIVEETYYREEPEYVQAIVMEAKTGDILAMSQYPDFDPNDAYATPVAITGEALTAYTEMDSTEKAQYLMQNVWRNGMVSNLYEPGSVFKLLTASAALETGVADPSSQVFYCDGAEEVEDKSIECHLYPNGHGVESLTQGVANSCNPAMIQAAQAVGYDRYYQYLELFGMTEPTGIDLPGEASPWVYSVDEAGPVEAATMAFGMGISVTPVEIISAVGALANDGKLMQPRLVKGYADESGNMVEEFAPVVRRQVVSSQTAAEMLAIMEYQPYSFLAGTGDFEYMEKFPYRVGSKTATAPLLVDGAYTLRNTGSVVSILPLDDPQYVVLVIVRDPKSENYGEVTAGPTMRAILEQLMNYYNIPPQYETGAEAAAPAAVEPAADEYETAKAQEEEAALLVPDVTGMLLTDAAALLGSYGLYYATETDDSAEPFTVASQWPAGGAEISPGGTVFLYADP